MMSRVHIIYVEATDQRRGLTNYKIMEMCDQKESQ